MLITTVLQMLKVAGASRQERLSEPPVGSPSFSAELLQQLGTDRSGGPNAPGYAGAPVPPPVATPNPEESPTPAAEPARGFGNLLRVFDNADRNRPALDIFE